MTDDNNQLSTKFLEFLVLKTIIEIYVIMILERLSRYTVCANNGSTCTSNAKPDPRFKFWIYLRREFFFPIKNIVSYITRDSSL